MKPHRVLLRLEVSAGVDSAARPVVEGGEAARGPGVVLQTSRGRKSQGGTLYHRHLTQPGTYMVHICSIISGASQNTMY